MSAKIPVFRTVGESYAFAATNLRLWFPWAWPAISLSLVGILILRDAQYPVWVAFAAIPVMLGQFVLIAPMLILCQLRILMGAVQPDLRFGRILFSSQCLKTAGLLFLWDSIFGHGVGTPMGVLIFLALMGIPLEYAIALTVVVTLLVWWPLVYAASRLLPMFPLIAAERGNTLRAALQLTKGSAHRISAVIVLVLAPILAVSIPAGVGLFDLLERKHVNLTALGGVGHIAMTMVSIALGILPMLVLAVAISHCVKRLSP